VTHAPGHMFVCDVESSALDGKTSMDDVGAPPPG
jgi:hypothetical protein